MGGKRGGTKSRRTQSKPASKPLVAPKNSRKPWPTALARFPMSICGKWCRWAQPERGAGRSSQGRRSLAVGASRHRASVRNGSASPRSPTLFSAGGCNRACHARSSARPPAQGLRPAGAMKGPRSVARVPCNPPQVGEHTGSAHESPREGLAVAKSRGGLHFLVRSSIVVTHAEARKGQGERCQPHCATRSHYSLRASTTATVVPRSAHLAAAV